eukprot:COSAG06_NODE_8003_length_2306_cov_1.574082_4_plen_77_part_00
MTITRKLPPGPDGVAPAMYFPINAATTVEFKGDRFLHAWVAHEFGAGKLRLFCAIFNAKTIKLPRQARDKHKEKKR